MKQTITALFLTSILCACGGGDGGEAPNDTSTPDLNAALPDTTQEIVVADPDPYQQSTLEYSAQQAAEQSNQTAQIMVSPEFEFRTSESVNLSLDFEEARGRRATVLICTEYSTEEGAHLVNYDSCLVRAPLLDGRLDHEMEILSRYNTVLSVVWFAEPGSEPLYREISLTEA